jgi:hypothetical protein
MNPWRQALFIGDPTKQRSEPGALFPVEGCADRIVVCLRDAANIRKYARPHVRHVQRVQAAVFGVIAALEQSAFLELVDERDESAGKHAEQGRQLLLADAGACGHSPQYPCLRGNQPYFGDSLREACSSMGPDLGDEERRGPWVTRPALRVRSTLHNPDDTS